MTSNAAAQLAILADALTEIVDLASGGPKADRAASRTAGAGRGSRRRSPCGRGDPGAIAAAHDCRRNARGRRDPRSATGAMTALYRQFGTVNRRARLP